MDHPPDTTTADELLLEVVDYLAEHGVADASFRSMADALGVSTYKFIYHFGSKGALLRAAVDAAVKNRIEEVRSWLDEGSHPTVGSIMKRYWAWFCQPGNQVITRLFFEINGLALRHPEAYPDVLRAYLLDGIELEKQIIAKTGLSSDLTEKLATVVCTGTWGMQLDLLNTGDAQRITSAFHFFADSIDDQILRLKLEYSSDGA